MRPNIIFVLLDGARCDRTKYFPKFVDLQKEGTLLNNVITAMPYTVGSINTIFTGLYGKENGIDGYYKVLDLKQSVKTLAEILQENGYFTSCDLLHKNVITKRGFDIHQAHNEYEDDLFLRHPKFLQKSFELSNDKPIFCFLHFTTIHTITVSEVLKKYEWDDTEFYDNIEKNLKRYDVVFQLACDYAIKIKNTIEDLDQSNNTILIFFSDHGTGVGERYGERNYGSFTYEETIRTFYLFIGKNILRNKLSEMLHSNLDLFPTILDLSGIGYDTSLPGKSWKEVLTKENAMESEDEYAFSETGALHGPFPSPEKSNVFCVKKSNYKLIYFEEPDKWELYDLLNDPGEKNNLYGKNITIEKELKEKLLIWKNR